MRKPTIPFVEYLLKKYTISQSVVLDIGCGSSPYRNTIDGTYIGLDLTDEDYAEGCSRDVDLVASATEIPMKSASCDLIFSVAAFYQIPDFKMALNEFQRVLKPGGRLLLIDYNRRTQKRLIISEGNLRPCWSQWRLKKLVKEVGFQKCELLLPLEYDENSPMKYIKLMKQELVGSWAIVTGLK